MHRLEGLSLGSRVVAQLALALRALAGPDAVQQLHLVLHLSPDQVEEAVAEMYQHKWFG